MMPAEKKSRHRGGFLIASCLAIICAVSTQLIPAAVAQTQQVTLTVEQVIVGNGSTTPPAAVFTYRLTPKSANAPMPQGSDPAGYTFTITGTGQASIGPIDFKWAQVNSYELTCITGAKDGYIVDTQVFAIDVYVPNDQPPITIVHKGDGTKTPRLSFTHHYIVPDPPIIPRDPPQTKAPSDPPQPKAPSDPPQTNDPGNPGLWIAVMAVSAILLILFMWRGRRLFSGKREERGA